MILRVAVLAIVLSIPAAAFADDKPHKELAVADDEQLYTCKSKTGDLAISFKPEIEIKELIVWAMSFTCKKILYDPRIISKKVTIIAPNKMSPPEAYRVFLAALSTIGYTLVPKERGRVLQVIESETAKRAPLPIYKNGVPDNSDQMVRYVYRPTYAPAESIIQAFSAVKSAPGEVQPIGSLVLVTDYASHVDNMLTLAKLIDVPKGTDGIYLLPVLHADARKLADEVSALMLMPTTTSAPPPGKPGEPRPPATASAAASPSKIIVDERTNTIVLAASESGYNRVKALVDRLDIPLDIEGGTTFHVYKLGGSIAEELAKTLNEAISGQSQAKPTPGKPGAPPPPPTPDPTGTSLEGAVRVIADKPTNALIVMSSGRDFLAIKELIKQLDLARRQVYIETVILEVSVDDSLGFGAGGHAILPGKNGSSIVGGMQLSPDVSSTSFESLANAKGLIGGLLGKALPATLFGQSIPSYGLLFQALAHTSNTNVVSAAHIIGLDNEETKHRVTNEHPFVKVTAQGFGDNSNVTRSVERQKLNLELNIKPHISFDDTVMLEIKHEAGELGKEVEGVGPAFNTRAMETKVVVRNQQTVVIGGLTQERERRSSDKVPLLGDIPILGHLFKYTKSEKVKTSLVIMLTPYIVKDQMDLQMIQERKFREHQEFVASFKSLDGAKYHPKIDYRRKRGLIEEINRTLIGVEEDLAARESFRKTPRVEPGPIENVPDDKP